MTEFPKAKIKVCDDFRVPLDSIFSDIVRRYEDISDLYSTDMEQKDDIKNRYVGTLLKDIDITAFELGVLFLKGDVKHTTYCDIMEDGTFIVEELKCRE